VLMGRGGGGLAEHAPTAPPPPPAPPRRVPPHGRRARGCFGWVPPPNGGGFFLFFNPPPPPPPTTTTTTTADTGRAAHRSPNATPCSQRAPDGHDRTNSLAKGSPLITRRPVLPDGGCAPASSQLRGWARRLPCGAGRALYHHILASTARFWMADGDLRYHRTPSILLISKPKFVRDHVYLRCPHYAAARTVLVAAMDTWCAAMQSL
jgi:hypothetical protein